MIARVFISYSAKEPTDRERRDELVAALQAANVPTWLDEARIKVGDEWLDRITRGLGECYAGIILFSQDALASDFVKYEVSCLAQRRRMHAGFRLFPLYLDDVTVDEIQTGFYGNIRFPDFQIGDFSTKLDEVVQHVKAIQPPDLTPTRELEDDLLKYFEPVGETTRRRIAEEKAWGTWQDLGPEAELLHFVRMFASEPLTVQIDVLKEVMAGLGAVHGVEEVFDKAKVSWVDEAAALHLDAVRRNPDCKRIALVNGSEPEFTCSAFLRRARPLGGSALRFDQSVPKGRLVEDQIAMQIRESLCAQFGVEVPDGSTPKQVEDFIDERLAKLERRYNVRPIHALLVQTCSLPPSTSYPTLKNLQSRFPKVTLVAMVGASGLPAAGDLEDCFTAVMPLLKTGENETHHNETHHNEEYAKECCDDSAIVFAALRPQTGDRG